MDIRILKSLTTCALYPFLDRGTDGLVHDGKGGMSIFNKDNDSKSARRTAQENLADFERAKELLLKVSARCEQLLAKVTPGSDEGAHAFAQRAMTGRILEAVVQIAILQKKIAESVEP